MDLNTDIGSLFKGLGRKKSGSEPEAAGRSVPHLKQLIFGLIIVAVVAAYLFFYYLPEQKRIRENEEMISNIPMIREEILQLDRQILVLQGELDAGKSRFEELNRLFHNKQELEDLYRNISLLALTYELLVAKLEKGEESPVFSDKPPIEQGEGIPPKKEVAFYKIEVQFEFVGDYISYTYFRRDLANQKKIINIEREQISARPNNAEANSDGVVQISTTLSTYRFPNSESEKFVSGG